MTVWLVFVYLKWYHKFISAFVSSCSSSSALAIYYLWVEASEQCLFFIFLLSLINKGHWTWPARWRFRSDCWGCSEPAAGACTRSRWESSTRRSSATSCASRPTACWAARRVRSSMQRDRRSPPPHLLTTRTRIRFTCRSSRHSSSSSPASQSIRGTVYPHIYSYNWQLHCV